jgi:hypothetical protein
MFYNFKSDGIITLRKHVDVDHGLIAKKLMQTSEQQHEKSNIGNTTCKENSCSKWECYL